MSKFRGLERLIRHGVLQQIQTMETGISSPGLSDSVMDEILRGSDVTKNVCAKLSIPLANRLDQTVNSIGCSKRRFIEAALIAAMERYEEIAEEEDLAEIVEQYAGGTNAQA